MWWMLVAGSLATGQTNEMVIDSFQYPTPAAAQAAWMPGLFGPDYASQPVLPVTEAGVSCLSLPNAFTSTTKRGYWYRTVDLDLSAHSVIAVRLKSTRPLMLVSLGFPTTGGGRYAKHFYITDQWTTYIFPMSSFGTETSPGPVSGWNNINQILLSCWQETDPTPATVYVSDLRASNGWNLLSNSGFEETTSEAMPDYWGATVNSWGTFLDQWVLDTDSWRARWGVDRTVNHTPGGANSLRIVKSTSLSDLGAVANYANLEADRTYTLSVWLRSDQPNLPVTLQVLGCTPSASESVTTSPTPGFWQRYSLNIFPTTSSASVSCGISPTGNGTLWVDDVQLEDGGIATDWRASLMDRDIRPTVHKVMPPIGDLVSTPGGDAVTVSIDSNRRFLVEGQPFIPIALGWGWLPSPAVVQHIAKAGFNTIVPYVRPSSSTAAIRAFLDSAKSNGLKVIVWAGRGVSVDTLGSWIDGLKDHPAVIMWYVYDEPISSLDWQEASDKYHLARTMDPSRPAMINRYYEASITKDWTGDVLSMDHYVIGIRNRRIGDVGSAVETLHQTAVTAGKPAWCWLQSAGYAQYCSREPTGAEAECMTYLALIHGSRGIMYFWQKPRTVEEWNELRLLTDELGTLTPVLYSMDTAATASANSPSIHLLSKSHEGERFLIAVNESPLPVTATLTASQAGSGSATALFESRNVSVVNGQITDTFGGYQRHVYSFPEPLVGHWKFDETSGILAADSSGNGHDGTLVNGPTWTSGQIRGALSFNGTNACVVTDNVAVNTSPGGYNTVAFWMKWNGGNNQMPFGWNGYYDLLLSGGSFGINTGEGNILGISSAGMAGQWVHVVVVFPNGVPSANNTKMFINGTEQIVTNRFGVTTASRTATPRCIISGWGPGSGYKFGGIVDDVRIYNRALTGSEVSVFDLVGHWKLDETSGVLGSDSSGNGHHGILVNAPAWTSGQIGGALSFNGTNACVVADNVAVNTTPGGYNTVAFWMKWNGGNYQMPFGWNGYYDLFFDGGRFGINTGQGNIVGISSTGMSGQWVHVAGVFPNGVPSTANSKIYINGVAQTLTGSATASRFSTSRVVISGWGADSRYKFGGIIDDVRIYSRDLNQNEISNLASP